MIWGIICSAFLLASTIMFHLEKYNNSIAQDISRNLYVDNLITGISSTVEGITYYKETKRILGKASMNMCQWASNDKYIMSKINVEDKCTDREIKV